MPPPSLRGLDLQQLDERRIVLLVERDNVDDAEALILAGDDLLARLEHHRVGRLTEIVPARRVKAIAEHLSSVSGAGRRTDATR
jgi:hypothetical protein